MSTELKKIKRLYNATRAGLVALLGPKGMGYNEEYDSLIFMEADGVTWKEFKNTDSVSGTINYIPMFTSGSAIGDTLLNVNGALLQWSESTNGASGLYLDNATDGTAAVSSLYLGGGGRVSALSQFAPSYTTDALRTNRLDLATDSNTDGINLVAKKTTGNIKSYIGTPASGTLFHTISTKGVAIANVALSTDADATVGGSSISTTITKNDANTRQFYANKTLVTLNTGGSNASTTIDIIQADTVNTAVTGMTVNLMNLKYGGTSKVRADSGGNLYSTYLNSSSLTDNYIPFQSSGKLASSLLYYNGTNEQLGIDVVPDSVLCIGQDNNNQAAVTMYNTDTTPTVSTGGASDSMRYYFKGAKFVFQYDDSGTTRYKYLDLTTTGVTWVHTTSAP